ncbi:hypothetical protein HK100_000924, partial [Physocladia obscura]
MRLEILIWVSFMIRVVVGLFPLIFVAAAVDSNGVCVSVTNKDVTIIDKVTEIVYSMVMAYLFLAPIINGMKEMDEMITHSSKSNVREINGTI